MIKSFVSLGSLVILLLVVFLCSLDDFVLQWRINPEKPAVRGVVSKAGIIGDEILVQKTARFVQRRFGCLYPNDENITTTASTSSSVCGCHIRMERQDDDDAAGAAGGFMSMADAAAPPPLERRSTLIPPNATFYTVNRTELLRGMGLSLEWEHSQGNLLVWHCRSSATPALTKMDARGWTFRVTAQNNQVQVALNIHHTSHIGDDENGPFFQLTFPEGIPNGSYNITAILLHVDQGAQDPPCFQNLTVRTHCKGETLWFNDFTQHVVFENVEYSHLSDQQQQQQQTSSSLLNETTTESKPLPCTSLDQLSPGYFRKTSDGDRIWTPAQCFWNATALTTTLQSVAASTTGSQQRVLLVGDSTFRYLAYAASDVAHYRKVLTPHDFQESFDAGMYQPSRWPSHTRTLIFGMGLHSTCYNNLQQDLDMLPDLVHALVDQWTSSGHRKVVIRSTTATALKNGLDYNAKKCLYYTDTRLQIWNSKLRELAAELNVTFWDEYNITASVGPSPGEWAATDGTHYCHPDPESSLCRQLVAMVRLAMQ